MNTNTPDVELEDRPRLIRGQRLGTLGLVCLLVGTSSMIASSAQTEWDAARSFYIVLMAIGMTGVTCGQKTLRPLMKKYLRPFPFIS